MRRLDVWSRLAALGALGFVIGLIVDWQHAVFAYLAAVAAALFLVLGMLFFVLLHHVSDAGWSTVVRRWAEQFLAAVPLLALLVLPVLVFSGTLYHWTRDEDLPAAKSAWLSFPFFLVRIVLYFAAWWWLARFFRQRSLQQDTSGDPELSLGLRRWSGPALVLYAFTTAFAAIDLLMTLDHHWFSTIFGVYCWSHGVLAAHAVLAILALRLRRGELRDKVPGSCVHDLGKWTFTFAVFWLYIAFSQWFLIWYSNLPEETHWMIVRTNGSWQGVAVVFVVALFVVPFATLLSSRAKRSPLLGKVAWGVLVGHWLAFLWIVQPVASPDGVAWSGLWIDLSALLLVTGLVGRVVQRALSKSPLYPVHDPRLPEAVPEEA
jgi:hypothetical protein